MALFALFGTKESTDADWIAAGAKDESARMPALMRFASKTAPSLRVGLRGLNEKVDVLRRAWAAVRRERVSADHEGADAV